MKLQRYTAYGSVSGGEGYAEIQLDEHGEYVRHADVEALEKSHAKLLVALEAVCNEADAYIGIGFDTGDESKGLQSCITTARAALASTQTHRRTGR